MRKVLSIFICCIIFLSVGMTTMADDYPKGFWPLNTKYEQALKAGNHKNVIEYGNQIINLMLKQPDSKQKRDVLVTRYKQVGLSYVALKDYENGRKIFQALYDYAKQYEDSYRDYVKSSKERVAQYTSQIKMYTDKGTAPYYGAKNEKRSGVLFGLCATGETRKKLANESMVLTYQELGQTLLAYNTGVMQKANASGCAVEFALNCPKEGADIRNINRMDSYLKQISDLFKKYPDVPVYLRFAAEFDIWSSKVSADEFKTAFRYVSQYFKTRNSNVAIVWSPNHTPNWYIDRDDYYPGDEYVDWVGVSLYAQKYFLSSTENLEESEVVFRTGINSNPVIVMKDIVETYGDRKPIMLSESGCGHKLTKSGEDTTDFALQRLREYYTYLPMVYPQIKLIAYFDWYVDDDSEKNDFRLSTNSTLQKEYLELVKGARYIQDKYSNNADYCNRPIYNGINLSSIFEVSCYAHLYGAKTQKVTYFIDGKYVGMSDEIPFTTVIDASKYSGTHTLKASAYFDNGKTLTTESKVNFGNLGSDVTVEIDDERINFDQPPIIYNDRTMVPMRKIFEELGASVSWDDNTKTATGRKGDRTVKVSVGQKIMHVNSSNIELDTAPIILGGRTLVPVRAVAEGLGCEVDWDGRNRVVSITPTVFRWSDWDEDLPSYVNEDLYYIEENEEYRVRTREIEYHYSDHRTGGSRFVGEEVEYGEWSDWQDSYISETDDREVETREISSPVRYHYAHYCTGNIDDKENRYSTANYEFCGECSYHDLGWFDSPLPYSDDSTSNYAYYVDGKKYRCSNTCFRWYLFETEGGSYTQYRSRDIEKTYIYWEWGDWSRWSQWDDDDPYDYYDWNDGSVDIDERTVYRYKEKG